MFWEDQREWGGDQGSVWEHVRQVSGKPGKRLDFLDFLYLPFWENVRLCLPCGCFSCFDSLKITIMLLLKIQQQLTLVVVEFLVLFVLWCIKWSWPLTSLFCKTPRAKPAIFWAIWLSCISCVAGPQDQGLLLIWTTTPHQIGVYVNTWNLWNSWICNFKKE